LQLAVAGELTLFW